MFTYLITFNGAQVKSSTSRWENGQSSQTCVGCMFGRAAEVPSSRVWGVHGKQLTGLAFYRHRAVGWPAIWWAVRHLQGRTEDHCVRIGQSSRDAPAGGTPGESNIPDSFIDNSSGKISSSTNCTWAIYKINMVRVLIISSLPLWETSLFLF